MAGGCHPKIYKRNYASWCEECEEVFGDELVARRHVDKTGHRINVQEYLVGEPIFASYVMESKKIKTNDIKSS